MWWYSILVGEFLAGLFDVQVDPTIELDELIAIRFDEEVLPNGTLKATRL